MTATSAFAATGGLIADPCFGEPLAAADARAAPSGWSLPAAAESQWERSGLKDGPAETALCWSAGEKDEVSPPVSTAFDADYYREYEVTFAVRAEPGVALRVTVGVERPLAETTAGPAGWKRHRLRFNTGDAGGRLPLRLAGVRTKSSAGGQAARLWVTDVQVRPIDGAGSGLVNLAKGRPCSFSTPPDYEGCTDPNDSAQLTDGVFTKGYFWGQKTTVGWGTAADKAITIDLGADQPIAGAAVSTAAGAAGAQWPDRLYLLASADGTNVFLVGDLVALSRAEYGDPPQGRYSHHGFRSTRLRTHGRYLTVVAQTSPTCKFFFTDEIEIDPGEPAARSPAYEGDWFPGVEAFLRANAAWRNYLDPKQNFDQRLASEGMKRVLVQYPRYQVVLSQASGSAVFKTAAQALQREWERLAAGGREGAPPDGFWRAESLADRSENLKSAYFLWRVQEGDK